MSNKQNDIWNEDRYESSLRHRRIAQRDPRIPQPYNFKDLVWVIVAGMLSVMVMYLVIMTVYLFFLASQ